MLRVEDVSVGYFEDILVLKNISMNVEKGSLTVIIGPNGAGKSTLLKTIFGFLKPAKGKIIFDGRDVTGLPPWKIKAMGVSYVPQEISAFPQLTVEENLKVGLWLFKNDKKFIRERIEEIYELFPNLARKRNIKASFLSGGEMRMLDIARSMASNPTLILVDEPSAGLAPRLTEEVYQKLIDIKEAGKTILLVDQNVRKAIEIAEYVYMIENGVVRLHGDGGFFRERFKEILRASILGEYSTLKGGEAR